MAVVLPLVAAGVTLALDRETGFASLAELRSRERVSRASVAELQDERARLIRSVRSLQARPEAVEAAARTGLGMIRPGEVLVRMPASRRLAATASGAN